MNRKSREIEEEKIYYSNFPFLIVGEFNNEEIIGILQNIKDNYLYIYVYNIIKNPTLRKRFLELGSKWWWESNRKIPINIFLGEDFLVFKNCLRIFSVKNFEIIYCPSLDYLNLKKITLKNIIFRNKETSFSHQQQTPKIHKNTSSL
ncbi:MAG: hypothetical protein QXF12_02620 [Candidatus Aenigmatarchaeota archaeon]